MATAKEQVAEKATAKKTYKLRSQNKYLTVGSMGVQFMKGIYTTQDPEVAKALLTLDGVELDEE